MISVIATTALFIIGMGNAAAKLATLQANIKETQFYFPAILSDFGGASLPLLGARGVLTESGGDACQITKLSETIKELKESAAYKALSSPPIIALISRGNCSFEAKIRNAETAGASAAVIFDMTGAFDNTTTFTSEPSKVSEFAGLLTMMPESTESGDVVSIPAAFISMQSGMVAGQLAETRSRNGNLLEVILYIIDDKRVYGMMRPRGIRANSLNFAADFLMITIIGLSITSCCGIISVVTVLYSRYAMHLQDQKKRRLWKLTKIELDTLPTHSFHGVTLTDDESDEPTCAICLDPFETGNSVRTLVCQHQFHQSCVDSWLTTHHRSCPTCRQDAVKRDAVNETI
eukprot:Partr_v1_DN27841_c1_g1_i4_m22985 putative Ring finger protein